MQGTNTTTAIHDLFSICANLRQVVHLAITSLEIVFQEVNVKLKMFVINCSLSAKSMWEALATKDSFI